MTRIQRVKNLKSLSIITENTFNAEVIQIPTSQITRPTHGCRNYLKTFILLILLVSVLLLFAPFDATSLWKDKEQVPNVQGQSFIEIRTSDIKAIAQKCARRVEPDMNLFDTVIIKRIADGPDIINRTNITGFNPRYMSNPFKLEQNNSKCLSFDKYARVLTRDSLKIIHERFEDQLQEFKITPLCILADGKYHYGWIFENFISVSKIQYISITREIMFVLLVLSESLKIEEKFINEGITHVEE